MDFISQIFARLSVVYETFGHAIEKALNEKTVPVPPPPICECATRLDLGVKFEKLLQDSRNVRVGCYMEMVQVHDFGKSIRDPKKHEHQPKITPNK